ncbi:unnamed protein product [Mytilus edulis]|uniref:Treslin n=1 Tax=Mytilus edulis TaxID=6550 RepID=A0A8S3UL95_MYTED|nr:unnamed protein product [Mytilus edulis]
MSSTSQNCQAVFLIDTFSEDDLEISLHYSRTLTLSIFRILGHLSADFPQNTKQKKTKHSLLKWGYKFFDSRLHCIKVEKYSFKEFKLKYFEEFERELLKRIKLVQKNVDAKSSSRKSSKMSPSDCLTRSLTDLTQDFEWETPDLFSPVKRRKIHQKKGSLNLDTEQASGNYVFMFTKCPKSAASLRQFAKKKNSFDIQSLKLVEDAIEKINGKVIPIDAVIQYGKQPLSCLSVQNIVFEFYFSRNSKQHLASCKGSSHQGILMYNGLQLCQLDIQILQKTHKRDTIRRSSDGPESCVSLNLPSVDGEITVQYNKLDLLQNLSVLEVYSTLHHSSSLSSHNEEVFICVGTSTDSCKSQRSSMFQNIISQLLNGKFDLVLLAKDLSRFFLMKPLTSVSATLTLVSTEVILEVEKQLIKKKDETFVAEDIEIPVKTNVKDWQGLMSKLCSSKVPNFKQEKNTDEKKKSIGGVFNPKCVDKTHLPGCQAPFITLIDKLNERISQLEFLSDSEVKTLRQLQKNYHIESRPPKLIDHTPQRSGLDVTQDNDKFNIHLDDNLLKDDKRKDSVPSRGQMILTRSKQAVKEKEEEPIKQTEGLTVKSKPVIDTPTNVDFKDENELKQYLCTMYDRNVNEDSSSLYAAVQPLVTITLYYMRESGKDNPQEACEQLLKSGIILSPESLREKHLNEDDIQMKIREYQLQIVLRLEVQSMIHGGDQNASVLEDKVDEIVTLLRTSLVENFIHNLPQMLGSIYDELMQPYPAELESILSPDQSAGDSSVFNQSLQSCGGDVSLSQPPSNVSDVLIDRAERKSSRSRKLIHHPSLADFGPKRQIVVATKSGKEKDQKTSTKHKRKEKDREKRKLERRQSVAVMETVKNSAKKRNKASHILKSPKYMKSSNRKLVSETPSHKQKGQNMWKRLEKERRRTQSVIDIKVVAESPVKLDVVEKQSPSEKNKPPRRSFYSAGPVNRSRSLTNSLELADRIAGRTSNFVKKQKDKVCLT